MKRFQKGTDTNCSSTFWGRAHSIHPWGGTGGLLGCIEGVEEKKPFCIPDDQFMSAFDVFHHKFYNSNVLESPRYWQPVWLILFYRSLYLFWFVSYTSGRLEPGLFDWSPAGPTIIIIGPRWPLTSDLWLDQTPEMPGWILVNTRRPLITERTSYLCLYTSQR